MASKPFINLPIISKFDDKGVKEAEGAFGGMGKALAGFAAVAATAFAAAGVGNFVKNSIIAASDLEESFNAINKSYGKFAGEVTALGDDVASRLGLTQVDFNGAAVRFSAFANKINGKGESVAGVVDTLTTRAADFASVYNIDVKEAMGVFQSGLSGEAEPLKRFGINLLQTEVAAYAVEAGIVAQGESMTEAQKVQARYGLLLRETANTAGDFADTSDGLANSQRILKATFGDLSAEVGTSLTPIVATFVSTLVPLANVIFPAIATFVENNVAPALVKLADVFKTLVGTISEGGSIGDVFTTIFGGISEWFTGGGLTAMFESFSEIRMKLIMAVLEALPGIIEGLVAFLPQLVGFIAGTLIPELLSNLILIVSEIAAVLAEVVPMLVDGIVAVAPDLFTAVASLIPVVITTLLGLVPDLLKSAITLFMSLIDGVLAILPSLLSTIIGLVPSIVNSVLKMLPELLDAAVNVFMGLVTAVVTIVPSLIETLLNLLPQIVNALVSMIPTLLDTAVDLFLKIVDAVVTAIPAIITAVIGMLPRIIDTLLNMIPQLISAGLTLFFSLVDAVIQATPQILTAVIGLIPQITKSLLDNLPKLVSAGMQLVAGLAKGIVDNAPKLLGQAVSSLGNTLVNGVKGFLGIKSPSKVFAELGSYVVEGFALGLDDGQGLIASASVDMAHNLKMSTDNAMSSMVPQAVVPSPSVMSTSNSNQQTSMNIVVNAGMGSDGDEIGRKIVDAIVKYERSSGRVFARA